MKKTITIVIPTYNEEENVKPMVEALSELFSSRLQKYDCEILFIDNDSQDNTQLYLKEICEKHNNVTAIFNAKNFGPFNSPYYGMLQASGEAVILLCADFQDPLDLIPQFVQEWENGYKIVIGKKMTSQENKIMYFLRSLYYKVIRKMSEIDQIEHFTGFGLYDSSFIEVLRDLHDPTPFLRGIVAELGWDRKEIPYEQQKRRAGKSHYSLYKYYDAAMLSFTSYTKIGLRMATFFGFLVAAVSFAIAIFYFVIKLLRWNDYNLGTASLTVGLFFLGAVQLMFIGFIGEYILSMNQRIMNRPLVIEATRVGKNKDKLIKEEK